MFDILLKFLLIKKLPVCGFTCSRICLQKVSYSESNKICFVLEKVSHKKIDKRMNIPKKKWIYFPDVVEKILDNSFIIVECILE
jgi:hypothetical protein